MPDRRFLRVLTGDKAGAFKVLYPFLPGKGPAFRVASSGQSPSPVCGMCFGRSDEEVFVAHRSGHVGLYRVPATLGRGERGELEPGEPRLLATAEAREHVRLEERVVPPHELERAAPEDPLRPRRETKGRVGRRELAAKRATGDVAKCVGYLPAGPGGLLFLIMADATVLRFRHRVGYGTGEGESGESGASGSGSDGEPVIGAGSASGAGSDAGSDADSDAGPDAPAPSTKRAPGALVARAPCQTAPIPPPSPSRSADSSDAEIDLGAGGPAFADRHTLTFESSFRMWVFEGRDAHPEAFHIVADPERGRAFCMVGGWRMGCRVYDAVTGRLEYVCEWPPRSVPANVLPRFWATAFAHCLETGSLFIGDMDGFVHCYQPGLWGPNAHRVGRLSAAEAAERIRTLPNREDVRQRDGLSAYHELTTDRDLLNPDRRLKPDRYSREYEARKAAEREALRCAAAGGLGAAERELAASEVRVVPQKRYRLRDCGIPGVEGAWSSAAVWRVRPYEIKVCGLAVAALGEGSGAPGGFFRHMLICANGEGRVDLLSARSGRHVRSFKGTFGAAKGIGGVELRGAGGEAGARGGEGGRGGAEALAVVGTLDKYVRVYSPRERQAVASVYVISDVLALLAGEARASGEGGGSGEGGESGESSAGDSGGPGAFGAPGSSRFSGPSGPSGPSSGSEGSESSEDSEGSGSSDGINLF